MLSLKKEVKRSVAEETIAFLHSEGLHGTGVVSASRIILFREWCNEYVQQQQVKTKFVKNHIHGWKRVDFMIQKRPVL